MLLIIRACFNTDTENTEISVLIVGVHITEIEFI